MGLPSIGLGTWKITDKEQMRQVVASAYQCGYRLFDTAAAYANEMALGKAILECGIAREDVLIQDKLWNTCYGYEEAQNACKRSLRKLKTDYLDVYLIHWPASYRRHENWIEINAETWRGMEQLYKEGYVRTIGVCNFKKHHLEELIKTAREVPFINQIEFHPGMLDSQIMSYCAQNEIKLQASSPLGNGRILGNETLRQMAAQKGVAVAQLCLRWELENGYIVLPKTTNEERMIENMKAYDVELNDEERKVLDEIPFCGGLAIDSDEVIDFEGL